MKIYKILVLIIISFTYKISLFSQTTSLELTRDMRAYFGVENLFTVLTEDMDCDSFILKTKYGAIRRDTSNTCEYYYKPKSYGSDIIYFVKISENNDSIIFSEKYISINVLPLVAGLNYTYNLQSISVEKLKRFPKYFSVEALNTGLDIIIPIKSFVVRVKHNCEITLIDDCLISDDLSTLQNEFSKLTKGDEIKFYAIEYELNGVILNAPDLILYIE